MDGGPMRFLQTNAYLIRNVKRFSDGQLTAPFGEMSVERLPLDVLHTDEVRIIILNEFIYGCNIGMIQGRGSLCFTKESLTSFLIIAEIPDQTVEWVQSFVQSPLFFLLLLNLFLLVVGCLMDIYSALIVVVPIILPISARFGIDPVHLGIIFLANLQLGYMTPPVGMNLFLASFTLDKPLARVARDVVPFLLIVAAVVLLVTYVPWLSIGILALTK